MESKSVLTIQNAVRLGGQIMPFLVIGILLVLLAMVVVVCLNNGPLYDPLIIGKTLML